MRLQLTADDIIDLIEAKMPAITIDYKHCPAVPGEMHVLLSGLHRASLCAHALF